jgi:predicted alpha-1,6-mannanase (GH76 family)
MNRNQPNPELIAAIENEGAIAWRKGYAFWNAPVFTARIYGKAWIRGYDRAANEFGDIYEGRSGTWEWRRDHGYVGDR